MTTPEQWRQMSFREQSALWLNLSEAERAAITQDEKIRDWARAKNGHEQERFSAPVVSLVLYVVSAVTAMCGLILFTVSKNLEAVICLASAFSTVAWGQMLDYIARSAFYTRRAAEMLQLLSQREQR